MLTNYKKLLEKIKEKSSHLIYELINFSSSDCSVIMDLFYVFNVVNVFTSSCKMGAGGRFTLSVVGFLGPGQLC